MSAFCRRVNGDGRSPHWPRFSTASPTASLSANDWLSRRRRNSPDWRENGDGNLFPAEMIVERGVQYLRLARFDRPAGILLLLWPTMWGVWSAAEGFPGVGWLSVFVVGVCATRAFGGVVNDIVDRRLDSQVWRTRDRPLASGAVSLAEAFGVALFFLLIAAALWWWALPPPAKWVAVAGLILTLVYPTIKHFFSMPQLMLGLVFSIGILVADSAIRNAFPSTTAWLFFRRQLLLDCRL